MKKFFSLLMAIFVLASALSFNASKARAAGLITLVDGRFVWGKGVVFVFEASGYKNKDLKGASIFAGSNDHKLSCSSNKEEGTVVCVANAGLTQYAGQTGVIYLAGQVFYATIPGKVLQTNDSGTNPCSELEEEEEICTDPDDPGGPDDPGDPGDPGPDPSTCTPPDVLGADVQFVDGEDVTTTQFVSGDTLAEVNASATSMLFGLQGWEDFQIAGPLECG